MKKIITLVFILSLTISQGLVSLALTPAPPTPSAPPTITHPTPPTLQPPPTLTAPAPPAIPPGVTPPPPVPVNPTQPSINQNSLPGINHAAIDAAQHAAEATQHFNAGNGVVGVAACNNDNKTECEINPSNCRWCRDACHPFRDCE